MLIRKPFGSPLSFVSSLSILALLMLGFLASPALADDGSKIDSGDTAWILVSTALVLFMTIPALALFYGGLVRTKNVLSVLMHCFAMAALISVLWVLFGYSVAFDDGNPFFGYFGKALLGGPGGEARDAVSGTIPETLLCAFQMTFAIITPALVIGAFV